MTKEEIEQYSRRFETFNDWEARQPPTERSPAAILAGLGFLWNLVPPRRAPARPGPGETRHPTHARDAGAGKRSEMTQRFVPAQGLIAR